ncbi:hypothetical protein HMPREF7215_1042 [Pyramidobacter piscolens W5455]|uniref:Uncharacterized protein n=1 Tax=Pyramidobacter piscolens W5455 TaxID=352165 RepID=A0ABM9ZS03_9BACT|nr:hypothetical protein HMPREF7215_1042 [Pyramidobacter piscolens W5455]
MKPAIENGEDPEHSGRALFLTSGKAARRNAGCVFHETYDSDLFD